MSQLNKLFFENYRIFGERQEIELRPVNFLIGPNSSGKSSLFKAILLLKSNIANDLQILDFSNTKHNLGSFINTINKNCENKKLTFGFEATINDSEPYSFNKISFTSKRSIYNVLIEDADKDLSVKVFLTYEQNDTSGKLRKIEIYKDNDDDAFLILEIGNNDSEYHKLFFNHTIIAKNNILNNIFIKNVIRDKYTVDKTIKTYSYKTSVNLTIGENKTSKYYDEPILVFSHLYDKFLENVISLNVNKTIHRFLKGLPLRRILKDFSYLIENTEYIEAVRANTKRLYTNDSQGTSFNELILEFRSRDLSQKAIDFLNLWLSKFEIADRIEFKNIEGVANTIYLVKNNEEIALADLGYGITQFLPILMRVALEEPINNKPYNILKKTILLEEPETNLHPKLQSLLADFIIDAINKFEIRFIIETHSEYMLRKMQVLTAEKKIKSSQTNIYYFNERKTNLEPKVKLLNIKDNGTLTGDFGEGFFDEASELKYKLLKYKNL